MLRSFIFKKKIDCFESFNCLKLTVLVLSNCLFSYNNTIQQIKIYNEAQYNETDRQGKNSACLLCVNKPCFSYILYIIIFTGWKS